MCNDTINETLTDKTVGAAERSMYSLRNISKVIAIALLSFTVLNCSKDTSTFSPSKYGVPASPRVVQPGEPVPKGGGSYMVGDPYKVAGKWYYPKFDPHYVAEGKSSWYGPLFHGRLTANGEVYDQDGLSAAHATMPLPSYARVTNLRNNSSIVLRVNDRGPYHADRIIDVSEKAAELLEIKPRGTANVRVEYLGRAGLDGLDYQKLYASYRPNGSDLPGTTQFASVVNTPKQDPRKSTQLASIPSAKQSATGTVLPRRKPNSTNQTVAKEQSVATKQVKYRLVKLETNANPIPLPRSRPNISG